MSKQTRNKLVSFSHVYRTVVRLHNAIPFHLIPSGHALPPWHYFFEVTRRCNMRCAMCQYRDWFERHPASELFETELDTQQWKDLVDQTSPFSLITFTGGEPWVRSDFQEILSYASTKRSTHFITNSLLMDEDRTARCVEMAPSSLLRSGLCFIGFSLDGTQETHDRIRGKEGSYEAVLNAIRTVNRLRKEQKKRLPYVHVTSVIQEANLDDLPRLPALLAEAGADAYNLTMEVRFPGMEGMGEVHPSELCKSAEPLPRLSPTRLEATLKQTQEAADGCNLELRLPDMPMGQVIQYYDGGLDLAQFSCRSPWTNVFVGAQGTVFPCFMRNLGNVREHTLRELWNGPGMREFRQEVRKQPFCLCQGCCFLEYKGKRRNGS